MTTKKRTFDGRELAPDELKQIKRQLDSLDSINVVSGRTKLTQWTTRCPCETISIPGSTRSTESDGAGQ
jgi:hypothetical protein